MGLIRLWVTCPYCGNGMYLNDCPIVATNCKEQAGAFPGEAGQGAMTGALPVSGRRPIGEHFGLPILWRPPPPPAPPPKSANPVMRLVESLQGDEEDQYERIDPVSRHGAHEDLPARACINCGLPLPNDIGIRQIFTIGVVGTTGAGKTHFIAALVRDGIQRQGLKKWGVDEFILDEDSAEIFRQSYQPFFFNRRVLESTNPTLADRIRSHPIAIRAKFRDGPPVTLLFHDIAGETLLSRRSRARYTPFLSRAAGLIFLIDPMMIEPIRKRLPGIPEGAAFVNQGDLVSACLTDLGARAPVTPLAIAVSKSDLIQEALPGPNVCFRTAPSLGREQADKELVQIDGEVRNLLRWAGAYDLLAIVDQLGRGAQVSFHAVAPIGFTPRPDPGNPGVSVAPEVTPLRCLDPLIAILRMLPFAPPAAR